MLRVVIREQSLNGDVETGTPVCMWGVCVWVAIRATRYATNNLLWDTLGEKVHCEKVHMERPANYQISTL